MQFLPFIIIPFIVSFILPFASALMQKNAKNKEREMNEKCFVMGASKGFGIIFLLLTIFFGICIAILNIFDELELAANIVLTAFLILMAIGCLQAFRQKIVVFEDRIIYTPIIGKTKKHFLSEIEKVVESRYSHGIIKYKVYCNKKTVFSVSSNSVGTNLLIRRFEENGVNIVRLK